MNRPRSAGSECAAGGRYGALETALGLSERQTEVLQLLASGARNPEIADHLVLGVRTVKFHIENLYQKLEVRSRTEAVRVARERGLLID